MRIPPVLAATLALAACAGPRLAGSPEPDRLGARRQLAQAAKAGPVPLTTVGNPSPLDPDEVPTLAARGVTGLSAAFTGALATTTAPPLVLWFEPPQDAGPQAACGHRPLPTVPANPPQLLAIWCDD